jgi:uncharacterized lipoprotein YehR (DUF1307 family)
VDAKSRKEGKNMKKIAILLALVCLVSVLLCGCGKFECELCGEEKSGKKYEGEVMGRTVVYCEECKEQVDSIRDMFN